jgi:hypothetical protein
MLSPCSMPPAARASAPSRRPSSKSVNLRRAGNSPPTSGRRSSSRRAAARPLSCLWSWSILPFLLCLTFVVLNVEPRFCDVAHPCCETLTLASPLILVSSLSTSVSSHRHVVTGDSIVRSPITVTLASICRWLQSLRCSP